MESLAELQNEYKDKDREQLLKLILSLKSEVAYMKKFIYSSKRDRRIELAEGQGKLFDEAEYYEAEKEKEEEQKKSPANKDPKKKTRKRRKSALGAHLPRVKKIIDLTDEEKAFWSSGGKLKKIGETVVERLEYLPARAVVIEETTIKYKCDCCENNFITPKKDPPPIPGSFATPSLIGAILAHKFVDGLPLYRQERIFQRIGVDLDRTTMASWVVKTGEMCSPLINSIHEDMLSEGVLHADETHYQVLKEKNKSAKTKSYMWTLGCQDSFKAVLFKYFPSRNANSAIELLTGFKGTLVCDGYSAYGKAASTLGFSLSACMAHIRRKFNHAEEVALKANPKAKPKASMAMDMIGSLYKVEEQIKDLPPDKKLEVRSEKTKPIFKQMEDWLLEYKEKILPSSPTGKAISYALKLWGRMGLFLENGQINIDNNFMENSIRPFVIGRKGWLFSNSVQGAEASANIYSLVESAKLNLLDPSDYLTLIIKELPKATNTEEIDKLLPYNVARYYDIKSYEPRL